MTSAAASASYAPKVICARSPGPSPTTYTLPMLVSFRVRWCRDTLCASDIVFHAEDPLFSATLRRDTQCHWHKVCHVSPRNQAPRLGCTAFTVATQSQRRWQGASAAAKVTPSPACFLTASAPLLPSTAARSQTLSTPTVCATKLEAVKLPSTAASASAE